MRLCKSKRLSMKIRRRYSLVEKEVSEISPVEADSSIARLSSPEVRVPFEDACWEPVCSVTAPSNDFLICRFQFDTPAETHPLWPRQAGCCPPPYAWRAISIRGCHPPRQGFRLRPLALPNRPKCVSSKYFPPSQRIQARQTACSQPLGCLPLPQRSKRYIFAMGR